jgi:hypothetical protein
MILKLCLVLISCLLITSILARTGAKGDKGEPGQDLRESSLNLENADVTLEQFVICLVANEWRKIYGQIEESREEKLL